MSIALSARSSKYSLGHVPREVVLRNLPRLVARDHATLAEILAHIAEVDAQRYFVPAAYSSMVAYCMGELRMSEDSALKRIRAARAAREFPAIFDAIAKGRLSLTAVVLLKKHLTGDTAGVLLAAAEGKSKTEIEQLIARVRQPELRAEESPTCTQVVPEPPPTTRQPANTVALTPANALAQAAPEPPSAVLTNPGFFAPTAPPRTSLHLSMDPETQDLLRYAQELLSHQIPSGSPAEVFKHSLKVAIREAERTKLAVTNKPRVSRKRSTNRARHIPAHVKRAVRKRDGWQCTFVSAAGRRCQSRTRLEFDHVLEYARGGEATVDGIRLRCRVHNQFTAEQAFGTDFMSRKREEARPSSRQRPLAEVAPEPPPLPTRAPNTALASLGRNGHLHR